MAIENILANISRLVQRPTTEVTHVSELATAASRFQPDAIVISGTLRDFDYYEQSILDNFGEFIRQTKTPVLAICGGHQLVGLSFGARVVTLDKLEQHEQRDDRPQEYQYRFIRITEPGDPIFEHINSDGVPMDSKQARILRVWQNHGLQLDRVPAGFTLLATSYLCRNQMMVKRTEGQLIYTVQFHLEKSFEDWNKSRTRWEHPNESRDGRILFENFLAIALRDVNCSSPRDKLADRFYCHKKPLPWRRANSPTVTNTWAEFSPITASHLSGGVPQASRLWFTSFLNNRCHLPRAQRCSSD